MQSSNTELVRNNTFITRECDNFVNVTKLCSNSGKRFSSWKRLSCAKLYIKTLLKELNLRGFKYEKIEDILIFDKRTKDTWCHPFIAHAVAQWISTEVAVLSSFWISEWRLFNKDNDKIYKYTLSNIKPDINSECLYTEKIIQQKWKNCNIEVQTPVGFIDVLTDDEIIEIKNILQWKHALGQILSYSHYYPNLQKRLHLFRTDNQEVNIENIINICSKYKVYVTIESDINFSNIINKDINLSDEIEEEYNEDEKIKLYNEIKEENEDDEEEIEDDEEDDEEDEEDDEEEDEEENESKVCTVCKIEKPLIEYYSRVENKDGFETKCKDCYNQIKLEQRRKNKEKLLKGSTKKCNDCNKVLSLAFFKAHPTSNDGYTNKCIKCQNIQAPQDTENKTCSKCHLSKPRDCFTNCKTSVDGLFSYCKECNKEYNAKHKAKIRPSKPTEPVSEQVCRKCNENKSIKYFKPHKQSITGYGYICIDCKT